MKLRRITDNLATIVITTGGVALVLVVIGILIFILSQALPLWRPSQSELRSSFSLTELLEVSELDVLAIGEEEQKQLLYAVTRDGRIHFVSLKERRLLRSQSVSGGEALIFARTLPSTTRLILVTRRGRIHDMEIKFSSVYDKAGRSIVPEVITSPSRWEDSTLIHARLFAASYEGDEFTAAWSDGGMTATLFRSFPDSNPERQILDTPHPVSAMIIHPSNRDLLLGMTNGAIDRWKWTSDGEAERVETTRPRYPEAITSMAYLIGDVTLITGGAKGDVEGWMLSRGKEPTDSYRLSLIRQFPAHDTSITTILPSWRNKSFLTADARGIMRLYHSTSEQLLLETLTDSAPVRLAAFSPKSDGAVLFNEQGRILDYSLDNPHPEVSVQTLWNKVWYESYDEPTYTWQSTGGTDDFEPKLSLIPLIFGTIKGTLYAMLFAVPLAIMGALYTSQFAHPRIRAIIKPTVEVMAALPSVVIGFMAGLWLAPIMKDALASFFLSIILVPLLLILFVTLVEQLPRRFIDRFKYGYEVFLMMPALLVAVALGSLAGSWFEDVLMDGDAQHWLYSTLNVGFDQRNCLVVGIALAFASMPIIFTITEDSLSSVPAHLTSASLALGANRWQTAIKVILPAASAGIFSAVMIGFGRAIGETMIVLMATGNTPIMDWSIFNGMRTLSANIAVEIPEAPHGGTLYRVLFLSGLILFVMTFVINTLAETVRQRLRRKYASL